MSPLEVLSATIHPWMNGFEIALQTSTVRPELVHRVLRKLEERELVVSRSDDEGGRVYQITAEGYRHNTENETKKRTSSFPPPRISWPPVR